MDICNKARSDEREREREIYRKHVTLRLRLLLHLRSSCPVSESAGMSD